MSITNRKSCYTCNFVSDNASWHDDSDLLEIIEFQSFCSGCMMANLEHIFDCSVCVKELYAKKFLKEKGSRKYK